MNRRMSLRDLVIYGVVLGLVVVMFWGLIVKADVVITDPVVGATTAEIDGASVSVDPALTINISTRFLPNGQVSWSVFPSLPGPNNYGPVWVAAVEDGSVYCAFSGCGNGRFGWHNVGGPLDIGVPFGGLDLGDYVGLGVVAIRTPSATTVRILTPAPLMPAETIEDLFDYLAAWFSGTVSETPVEYVERWFAQ